MKTNYTFFRRSLNTIPICVGLLLTFTVFTGGIQAQTQPTPQSLPYSQDFSTLDGAQTIFPDGWQAWQVAGSAPSSTGRTSVPASNKNLIGGTAASTSSGAYDFNGKIGFMSVGSSDVTLCLALNTTAQCNLKITFDAMTIRNLWDGTNSTNFQNGLVLQYRVGSTSTFINLAYSPAEFLSGKTVQTSGTDGINPVLGLHAFLPAECENQAIVQIRWIYRNAPGGTSGSRPNMALDNISVQQIPVTFTFNWPKVEDPTVGGFTVKSNINTSGTTYYVVLPNGATTPTSAQVKAGQDATGTSVADNEKGSIVNTTDATEFVAAVTGLSGNTTYDVYFVAEGNSGASLQSTPQKVTVLTTNSAFAPTITDATATNIQNAAGVNSVSLGGNITSDGGSALMERGTVWKAATGVTIDDNKLADGNTATGIFTSSRTGMPSKTQIYYKAYASDTIGTSFTTESSFFTIADEPTSAVGSFAAVPTDGSSSSLDLSWTTATGADGYIIIVRSGSTGPGTVPSDLTNYSVGDGIGTGTVGAIVNSGSATNQTITGLISNQLYTIRIYPFGYNGVNAETINYASTLFQSITGTTNIGTDVMSFESKIELFVLGNSINITGAKNQNIRVALITGQILKSQQITSDNESISLSNGLYIVSIGNLRYKLLLNK